MKNLCFLLTVFIGVTAGLKAQVTGISIEVDETFTDPLPDLDLTGYTVFSVYANFTNPNDFISAVYGIFNQPENIIVNFTCDCFNSPFAGITGGENNPAFWPTFPSMQYDSYLTIGMESSADPGSAQFIAANPPTAVAVNEFNNNCSMNVDDGAVFTTYPNPNGFAGDDLKIKIAQFTTCGNFCFEFGLQVFVNGNQMDEVRTNHAICSDLCTLNPLEDTITLVQGFDCEGNPAIIEFGGGGNGDVTYELYDDNGGNPILISFQTNDPTFEVTEGGEYYGVLIDQVGCSVQTDIIPLDDPNPLVITQTSFTDILCASDGGEICIDVSGGTAPYDVTALLPDGNTVNMNDPDCLSGIQCSNGNGTVTITATDSQGCVAVFEVEFACPAPLELDLDATPPGCGGGQDAELEFTLTGGTFPYDATVIIPGGVLTFTDLSQTNFTIDQLIAGNYSVTITDANGCEVQASITIDEPEPLELEADITAPSCEEACNGSVDLSASGGTGPYNFTLLQNGQPVSTENLCEGAYVAQVTDANGCETEINVNVVAGQSDLNLNATADDLSCFGICDGEVNFSASGGDTPYAFTLTLNGQPVANGDLCDGNYVAVVTDAVGCTAQDNVSIDSPDALTGFVLPADSICQYDPEGNLNYAGELCVTGAGGTPGYTYSLNNGPSQNNNCFTELAAGTYEITIEDENGCTLEVSGLVPVVSDPNHPLYPICFPAIVIPNIFSPNGDNSNNGEGTNEFFFIDGLQAYPNSKIRIFNRWGNLVFESDNYKNNWDANGAEDGVYFYTLEVNVLGNFSGTVTVVR